MNANQPIALLKNIKIENFKVKKGVQAFIWIQKSEDKSKEIIISYKNLGSGCIWLDAFAAEIRFFEIENIIDEMIRKDEELGSSVLFTISKTFSRFPLADLSILTAQVSNEVEFERFEKQVQAVIHHGIFPFFQKYDTLSDVAELYATLKPEEVTPYIPRPILFLKAILVLKLATHPNFTQKREEYHQSLIGYAQKSPSYKHLLTAYESLFYSD